MFMFGIIFQHIQSFTKTCKSYKFNVIEQDLFTENIDMRFDKVLSNPPYDDGMYKDNETNAKSSTEDGEFQFRS